ncbi:hypothetical protein JTE90_021229 [Oedothorax gibbosus]|uniref:Uncharacterized protein n=1 Tax=Oedothorax gibbosus TaxID=931172 RepID=A0AAV6UWN5_9ARAC|nr:hypothetical protein JTE90_021229 [Oedothorax gibbosus]
MRSICSLTAGQALGDPDGGDVARDGPAAGVQAVPPVPPYRQLLAGGAQDELERQGPAAETVGVQPCCEDICR